MLQWEKRRCGRVTGLLVAATWLMLGASTAAGIQCAVRDNIRYVRQCAPSNAAECNDANDGRAPQTAWATLQSAAMYFNRDGASPGEIVIVGPGLYREGNIDLHRSGNARFPKMFLGDSRGECTGDPPGPVLLDAQSSCRGDRCDVGFLVFGASYVVVSGFEITNARDAGVQVRRGPFGERSVGVTVANNVIFENGLNEISRGIDVTDAEGTTIFNNLVYRNAGNGIGVLSAPRSKIINNTVYGHPRFGVVIAQQPATSPGPAPTPTPGPSTGSWLLNNIIADNATGPEVAFSVDVDAMSACDYIGAFNLISAPEDRRYAEESPRDRSDILADPAFVDTDHDDFHLRDDSVAIDAGSDLATRLQLGAASTVTDGSPDRSSVDLGYHFNSAVVPMFDAVPATTQMVFVRAGGDDADDGTTPERALRTIGAAVEHSRALAQIIVGPGMYRETVALSASSPAGPVEFFADALGRFTDDTPGRVVVDAHHATDGFNVVEHCSTVIDGFVVMNGRGDGIRLRGAHGSIVRNNTTVSNRSRGINVVDTDDVQIRNNLTYANVGGIQIGGNSVGSQRTVIESNTVYGNEADGVLIGTGPVASTGTQVRYNIIDDNGQNGLQLDDNIRAGRSAVGFCAAFNLVYDDDPTKRYGPIRNENCHICLQGTAAEGPCAQPMCLRTGGEGQCMLVPREDLPVDPDFARPVTGRDGCLGGRRFWDDAFWLAPGSPAIGFGESERVTARSVDLNDRTTESCEIVDRDWLDAGYHAPEECFGDNPPLTGDCNADYCVTVDEVVTGVNIALDRRLPSSCPPFDLNGDGRVTVDELVSAVNDLFCCTGAAASR